VSFTVVGSDGLPVVPTEAFLVHLSAKGASPNTVAGYAHDLRDFLTWLLLHGAGFRELSLEELAEFFAWLRRPKAARAAGVFMLPGAPAALGNSTLARKRAAVASFYRFHARRDESVPALLGELTGVRPTGGYQPMLIHTRRRGPGADAGSPIRIPAYRKPPKTLTRQELRRLKDSCTCLRDLFLLTILEETGLRLGEALGLRHSDLHLRAAEVHVIPREDNANQARAKGLKARIVPARGELFDLYAEYGSLDCDSKPPTQKSAGSGQGSDAPVCHRLQPLCRECRHDGCHDEAPVAIPPLNRETLARVAPHRG